MADIFGYNRSAKPAGVFSLTGSKMNISGGSAGTANGTEGFLVQNWRTNYTQEVREIFEIGSDSMYWAKGRPSGTANIDRIVGAKDAATGGKMFPDKAYDLCDGGVMVTLSARGGSCAGNSNTGGAAVNQGVKIKMDGVVVSSIGFAMQVAADIQLNESIGWRFAFMEISSF